MANKKINTISESTLAAAKMIKDLGYYKRELEFYNKIFQNFDSSFVQFGNDWSVDPEIRIFLKKKIYSIDNLIEVLENAKINFGREKKTKREINNNEDSIVEYREYEKALISQITYNSYSKFPKYWNLEVYTPKIKSDMRVYNKKD